MMKQLLSRFRLWFRTWFTAWWHSEIAQTVLAALVYTFIALMFFFGIIFGSCTRTPKQLTITQYKTQYQTDTLRLWDSIYVSSRTTTQHDTVFCRDTILRFRILKQKELSTIRDSVPYPVEVVREVQRPRTAYDRFCSCFMWITCTAIVAFIALKILKLIRG